jgi:hypothetical protein
MTRKQGKENVTSDNRKRTTKRNGELTKRIARKLRNDGDNDSSGNPDRNRGDATTSGTDSGERPSASVRGSGESESPYERVRISESINDGENESDRNDSERSASGDRSGGSGGSDGDKRNRSDGDNGTGNGNPQIIITNSPDDSGESTKNISFDSLFTSTKGKRGRKPGSKNRKSSNYDIPGLEDLFKLLYSMPMIFGLGDHWEIDDVEAQELKRAFVKVAGNIDSKNFVRILHAIEKLTPWAGLVICFYIITMPRIKLTGELFNESKGTKGTVHPINPVGASPSGDSGTNQTSGQYPN